MRRRLIQGILYSLLVVIALFLFTPGTSPVNGEDNKELTVVFLDVGQGDSTLIITPGGKHILIDGGLGGAKFSKQDCGKKVILPYLRRKKISHLDTVIMTHPDFDHIGGLISVFNEKNVKIDEVLDPGVPHPSEAYLELLQAIDERPESAYRQPRTGDILDWGAEVKAEVLSPPYLMEDNNECSLVVKLTYGDISFLLTGDAAGVAEGLMVKKYGRKLKSAILKAGHHGSKHSSTEKFLDEVDPEIAVVSCGGTNKYGHPHEEVIERLEKAGTKIYRTDHQGTITVTTDGKQYQVETEKK